MSLANDQYHNVVI